MKRKYFIPELIVVLVILIILCFMFIPKFLEAQKDSGDNVQLFPVYYADYPDWQKEMVVFYLPVKENLPVKGKLEELCSGLSRFVFDYLPIELVKIEEKNGKKTAVINLVDPNNKKEKIWNTHFFQGSTGAHFTQSALILTLLQPGYKGEWVDCLVFQYNGKPFKDEWDHLSLHGTYCSEMDISLWNKELFTPEHSD